MLLDTTGKKAGRQDVNPDARGMWGNTALIVATQFGHYDLAIRLVHEWGSDPSLSNDKNVTTMLLASVEGNVPLVKALLRPVSMGGGGVSEEDQSAKVALVDPLPGVVYNSVTDQIERLTCMQAAATNGHVEIVRCVRVLLSLAHVST